jgi:ring-1,2-phenylacetyl-CoA epoxidase subunit PaaD
VVTAERTAAELAWSVAAAVPDPELPMLTIADLGILRGVTVDETAVVVAITPTYSGCPAVPEMRRELRHRLRAAGFEEITVRTELAPPWTSDWITAQGRAKLAAAGIAPPDAAAARTAGPIPLTLSPRSPAVSCPRCGATDVRRTAAFSATACTASYRCGECDEPFDYFKDF